MFPYQQFTLLRGNIHQPEPDTQVSDSSPFHFTSLIIRKLPTGVTPDFSLQPPDASSSSRVSDFPCPTSSSEISVKGTTAQVSESALHRRSRGGPRYSSYVVKSPRFLLLKREPPTNQTQSHSNRTITEPEKDVVTESPFASPSPSTAKKPARLAKAELRIQESFETDDEKVTEGVREEEEDQSQVQELKEDIRQSTYRRMDNLEETIRELELSLIDFGTQTIPTWSQGTPDMDSASTSASSGAPVKISARREIQRPPVPPKPFITSDVAKVHETHSALSVSRSSCSYSLLILLSAIDPQVIRRHDSKPPVSFCPPVLFIFFLSHCLFGARPIKLSFISSSPLIFCNNSLTV